MNFGMTMDEKKKEKWVERMKIVCIESRIKMDRKNKRIKNTKKKRKEKKSKNKYIEIN